jgi:hypothetical protein
MTSPHFGKVSLFLIGSMIDLPGRIASRLLCGGFRGFPNAKTLRGEAKPLCPTDESQIPARFVGPLTTPILAEDYLLPPVQ